MKYLKWCRSWAKVTAPALAKYPGSETLLNGGESPKLLLKTADPNNTSQCRF